MTPAASLARLLGDPHDAGNELGYARAVELDEAEAYPEAAIAALEAWGLHRHYVPRALGGELDSLEELVALVRLVSRRNLTVSVCHTKTFYGAVPVWVGGDEAQRRRAAATLLAGGQASLGYHEKDHGSDLLAVETAATRDGDGWRVDGTKWLVNNATRGAAMSLFARTDPAGGPRAHSVFWLDKAEVDPATLRYLPRLRPLGIRGADFSGVAFDGTRLPGHALLGAPGSGLELSMRAFQLTRAIMPAISLGAADAGLRVTLDFATRRALYGGTVVVDLPYPRAILAGAYAALLAGECLLGATVRALHAAPTQLRAWSSIAKYVVPVEVQASLGELATVLGARHYLREEHDAGVFQKILRDHAVVPVFHAGGFLLLQTTAQYVRWLAARRGAASAELPAADALYRRDRPLPPLDLGALGGAFHDAGDPGRGFAAARARLADDRAVDGEVRRALEALLAEGEAVAAADATRLADQARVLGRELGASAELLELARRFAQLTGAATAALTWLANRAAIDPALAGGEWLAVALHRTLAALAGGRPALPARLVDATAAAMRAQHAAGRAFSLFPAALGD